MHAIVVTLACIQQNCDKRVQPLIKLSLGEKVVKLKVVTKKWLK